MSSPDRAPIPHIDRTVSGKEESLSHREKTDERMEIDATSIYANMYMYMVTSVKVAI